MTANTRALATRLCIAAGFLLTAGYQSRTASAAVIYDESVDGDLPFFSSQGPPPVLTLRNGANEVRGTIAGSGDFDRFNILIAPGAQLTGITLSTADVIGDTLSVTWAIADSRNSTFFSGSFAVPTTNQALPSTLFPIGPGTYRISDSAFSFRANPFTAGWDFSFTVVNGPGVSQSSPVLPSSQSGNIFFFSNVPSGLWCDPPLVSGLHYEMTSPGSLFTGITGFPTGFSSPFTVSANGVTLGQFIPGQTLTFAGSGVTAFDVTGINPLADAANGAAFPLQLQFSTPSASFTMQGIEAVPEPASLAIWSLGAVGIAIARHRRRTRGWRVA